MSGKLTSRGRMLTAIRNQIPDRVPVAPDISNMVPTRLSGRGYFNVYVHEDPPLWRAYIDAVKYYGMDGWFTYAGLDFATLDVETSERWVLDTEEKKVRETIFNTPAGKLTEQTLFCADKPPIRVKKVVVDIDRDWPGLKCLLGPIVAADDSRIRRQRAELGELGVLGGYVGTPGLHSWFDLFDGGIPALSYLSVDRPSLLDELRELHHARLMDELGHVVRAGLDLILSGGSGSVTLASPRLWRRYALPTLLEVCRICHAGGIPTMVHSCGKERYMVQTCARETLLNCINPLEVPPMGDVTLAEAKEIVRGTQLSLMGNLHTTEIMLMGSVKQVKSAARRALRDAGGGGGFILSTGDQCGTDTPDENIFALVETVEKFGVYDALGCLPALAAAETEIDN